jgi:hypothetical protein
MLVYSELSIHLLKVHHFCQGLGSPFRLAPDSSRNSSKNEAAHAVSATR